MRVRVAGAALRLVVVALAGGLLLSGCYAQTEPASNVGSTSATLNMHGFTNSNPANAFFQYSPAKAGLGTVFGKQTPTLTFGPNVSAPFAWHVTDLSPGTNYFFRACGNDVGKPVVCNSDLEFTTVVPGAAAAFGPPLATGGYVPYATGDFNGDGTPDLIVAEAFGPPEIDDVLLGNGDGTFTKAGAIDNSGPVAVGDFNRDGKLDLVVGVPGDPGSIEVLPGHGDGTFGPPTMTPVAEIPSTVSVADFNRDGRPDIAITMVSAYGRLYGTVAQVMLGNGNGTFQPPDQSFPAQRSEFQAAKWTGLVTGDFNRDGRLDMALSEADCDTPSDCGVSLFLGNGNGTFGSPRVYDSGHDDDGLVVGDFHGTGKLDLATTRQLTGPDYSDNGPTILDGNGDGGFQVGPTYTQAGETLGGVADINGDGKLDLVDRLVINPSGPGYATHGTLVRLGNGDGTFESPVTASGDCGVDVSADFNGDGKPDIACSPSPAGPNSSRVLLNATAPPGGTVVRSARPSAPWSSPNVSAASR